MNTISDQKITLNRPKISIKVTKNKLYLVHCEAGQTSHCYATKQNLSKKQKKVFGLGSL